MNEQKITPINNYRDKIQKVEPRPLTEIEQRRKDAIMQLVQFRGEVPSKNTINALPELKEGEIFWVTSDNKAYVVAEKDKKKIVIKALDENASISTGLTIYEMNKKIVSKEPLLNWEDENFILELKENFRKWIEDDINDNRYFLLYGRDLHYITLFDLNDYRCGATDFLSIMKDTLKDVGEVISFDFNSNDNKEVCIEIWVRTPDSAAELLYLFPYDRGVIKI